MEILSQRRIAVHILEEAARLLLFIWKKTLDKNGDPVVEYSYTLGAAGELFDRVDVG